ncbi:hypothetical protein AUJ62_00425 [Candidatus Pacearchaeota archaeon CG1_02_32_21]|nr:MAG: hypothetical protein AUJ62_00425 [Candidatus Pacearchaeota archaeon CG1_02_32_21]
MTEQPKTLRDLLEQEVIKLARLPQKNDFLLVDDRIDLSRLDSLEGYTIPLTDHDYGAKTPLMWNSLYERLGLNIRNIMVVANPKDLELIVDVFRQDPKYLGGGFGSGFKDVGIKYLDKVSPEDLEAVNIVVKKEGKIVGYNTDAQGFLRSLEDKFKEIGKDTKGANYVILGAGGVAKEIVRLIAQKNPGRIAILNRTISKAVDLAAKINAQYGGKSGIAVAGGEDIIRGYLLNSFIRPDAIINLTNKGSDGTFEDFAAFATADDKGYNENISRTIARELSRLNPEVIVADITLHKSGKTKTLRIAENEGLKNIIDGIPMVVNQAAPAYIYVQEAHPKIHKKIISEEEALSVFREVTKLE